MNEYNPQDPQTRAEHEQHKKVGKAMLFACWLLILGGAYFIFKWYEYKSEGIYNTVTVKSPSGSIELHIPLTGGDRYEVLGAINNFQVKFLIDTGATSIAISSHVAQKANLKLGMPIDMLTAGGKVTAHTTRIANLYIGSNHDIQIRDINAIISPEMPDDTVLLGMGALKQLNFRQIGDKLILEYSSTRP